MLSRHISPHIWWALLRRTAFEAKWLIALGAVFLLVILMPSFNPELNAAGQSPDGTLPGRLTLAQRLGYAILMNSGFGTLQSLTNAERDALRAQAQLPWPINISGGLPLASCIPDDQVKVGEENVSIQALSLSIISAEMYNRDGFTRNNKFFISRIYKNIFGSIPNFSYGIAQVKLSTAKKILKETFDGKLDDDDVLVLLRSDCDNANIAARYIENLVNQQASSGNVDEVIRNVAEAYQGANEYSEGTRLYIESVIGAYYLLHPEPEATDQGAVDNNVGFCIGFPRGEVAGTVDTAMPDFFHDHPEALQVDIKGELWTDEDKPPIYRASLEASRTKWLNEKLQEFGVDSARVKIIQVDASEFKKRFHNFGECDRSFAKITLDMLMPAAPVIPPDAGDKPEGDPQIPDTSVPNSESDASSKKTPSKISKAPGRPITGQPHRTSKTTSSQPPAGR